MKSILCVDNSGSTSGCIAYWTQVQSIYDTIKPARLIFWNTQATEMATFDRKSWGGTSPDCFIKFLEQETEPYQLIITTDGEISETDMVRCNIMITPKILSLVHSTTIHYIGREQNMNIGLNIIFGRTKAMSYYINEKNFENLYETFEDLQLEDLMSPNFAISLIVKIKNIELTYPDTLVCENKISELRGEICRLYSKLERESLDTSVDARLESFFKNNQVKEFVDLLSKDRQDVQETNRQKTATLNLFDRKIDLNISRITAAATIVEQQIDVPVEAESAWNEFEDTITLDKFNLPCLLVQDTHNPLITDKDILKHPLKLLSEPGIIKKIIQLVEPNPIDYETYKKLTIDHQGYTVSPYTRAKCKGVFLVETIDFKCIKNNCRSISVLFGNDNKVPGNLVLWNLIILFLLHKYKFDNTEYKTVIFDEIIKYCRTFKTTLSFTHQCQLPRLARLEICLWYCTQAAPRVCPNTSKNVLRSSFGMELLELYLYTFGQNDDEYLKELLHQTKKWAVWNYMLANKHRSDLKYEIKAQYQNYCIHKDKIILLKGKCNTPFKSKCNILDADTVNTLYANVTNYSTKFEDIDKFERVPVVVDEADDNDVNERLSHVKINIKTCWPYVICPITKLHWKECAGVYDIKSGSLVRLFNNYCTKYRKYPESHMDLALLYSRRVDNVTLQSSLTNFQYIYTIFEDVMNKYTSDEYIAIYDKHTDEQLRLSNE